VQTLPARSPGPRPPQALELTVLAEGSSPARAAGAGPADVVTGSAVLTL